MWFWSVLGQKTTFLSIWGLTCKIKGFGQKAQYLEVAEISAISQKFLFSHIQNKIPNIFFNHDFLISQLHHGHLLWGGPPLGSSNTSNYHLSFWHDIYPAGKRDGGAVNLPAFFKMSLYLFDDGGYGGASTLEMTCSRRRIRIWVEWLISATFGHIPAKMAQGLTFANFSLNLIRDFCIFGHNFPKSGIFRPIGKNQAIFSYKEAF